MVQLQLLSSQSRSGKSQLSALPAAVSKGISGFISSRLCIARTDLDLTRGHTLPLSEMMTSTGEWLGLPWAHLHLPWKHLLGRMQLELPHLGPL